MNRHHLKKAHALLAGSALSLLLATTGCGAFFQCEGKADCGTSTTTSGVGDYAYISNSASGSTYIDGFQVSGGSLVTATGFPASLGFVPSAMAITQNDAYLFIGSSGAQGGIYGYSIGTGGAITAINSGSQLEAENCVAIAISPDGQWLFSLNANYTTMEEYKIGTGGLLTYATNYAINNTSGAGTQSSAITFSPNGTYIAVAMDLAGFDTFSFNTSTGAAAFATQTTNFPSNSGPLALATDSSNNLYVAASGNLYTYSVNSSGIPTQLTQTTTGTPSLSLALDASSYVYAGYQTTTSSLISEFAISTTGSSLIGSSYVAPTTVAALAVDKTSTYLVAAGYNSTSGIQLFQIGSTGTITSIASAASGTTLTVPTVIAMTH